MNVFKNDDEHDFIDEPIEKEQTQQKREASREMETRVTYQYPKGEFRFPIIPDEPQQPRRRHPRSSGVDKRETKQQQQPDKEVRQPERKKRTPATAPKNEKTPQEETPVTRNERDAQNRKRPFKPTEIPSPIYGFERPRAVKKEESKPIVDSVEYELNSGSSHLNENSPINQENSEPIVKVLEDEIKAFKVEKKIEYHQQTGFDSLHNGNTVHFPERMADHVVYPKESESKVQSLEDKTVEFELDSTIDDDSQFFATLENVEAIHFPKSPSDQSVLEEEPESIIKIGEGEPEELEDAIEGQSADFSASKTVLFPESRAVRSLDEEEPESIIEVVEDETKELEFEGAIDASEPIHYSESTAYNFSNEREYAAAVEKLNVPIAQENADTSEENVAVKHTSVEGDSVEPIQPDAESEVVVEIESPWLDSEAVIEEGVGEEIQEQSNSTSRSHIPFNVIMLNSDKQKNSVQKPKLQVEKAGYVEEIMEENTVRVDIQEDEEGLPPHYIFPSKSLLTPPVVEEEDSAWLLEQENLLNSTLLNFNVRASVVNVTKGPAVTRFEVQPEPGVKVNKITNLSDDIKLSLAARDIRIEAPIPGKHTIGIEVPNQSSRPVLISEIINSPEFKDGGSPLTAVLGLDIAGKPVVTDLRKMPHGLIAGATGSGKSVCINSILVSLLYKSTPEELKLLLIDPKMVELAPYNHIPHLVSPVITDVKAATAALKWAVDEMERRYELFAHAGVRDINRYNETAEANRDFSKKLPFIVIIIDELADLMMMSPADVEEAICRIAQKARACGIHLIIATQRPSVDVITGLIKANVPTRVAFSVSSQIDSRTIIDISGAEKLLGRGDMLFLENGSSKPVRLQGTYVSDREIDEVVSHVRKEQSPQFLFEQEELLKRAKITEEEDELFYDACKFVVDHQSASTSSLQRKFKIGYNRAARLIDMMEQQGYISENRGSKPRDVLITEANLETINEN
ncbi:S-DNA-T family DNA segregation ATPase FtsK/SpoIIIE [Cytobacillus purgationiresistens]|uniref:S-DNA-T family DNA segregation ATPase FtsK/SpoIIIE n=2 Tax=Cytobacillus purgationiresistens TaxID=863449 RepID=A0ABU0AN78_9BACI|nr:S-DNA-T family DNA segregation ATPase FtsK/SpoIIIE [Cytobacillus purgationiresistens]